MRFTPRYLYLFLEKNAVKVLLGFMFLATRDRAKTESMRQSITQFFEPPLKPHEGGAYSAG